MFIITNEKTKVFKIETMLMKELVKLQVDFFPQTEK